MRNPLHPNQLRTGDTVRDFHVVRRLGVGGYAFVFLVEREGRPYSMKMAAQPVSEEDEDRVDAWFRREVVSLESLVHPQLLPVLERGRWPDPETGYAWFVTPYVPASTFHAWRWREGASLDRAVRVLCELLKPLEALHERGVLHRDLKADNVLVREGDDTPFLIDFGAVHLPWAPPLTEGLAPGTLYCQPPEAITFVVREAARPGSRLTARPSADLYTFGVLLYETLTGCRPFSARLKLEELLVAIAIAPPPEPQTLAPEAPASLCALALRLLAKDPEQRPASARAVREELERLRREEGHTEAWRTPAKSPAGCARLKDRFPEVDVLEAPREDSQEPAPSPPVEAARPPGASRWRLGRVGCLGMLALGVGVLGVGWGLFHVESTTPVLPASSEKGTQSMSSSPAEAPTPPSLSRSAPSRLCVLVTSLVSATAAQLVGCATIPRGPDPIGYLSRCSAEARATPVKLGFASDENPTFLEETGTPASADPISEGGPLNLKPGPVTAAMFANIQGEEVEFRVTGEVMTWPQRVYIQLDRLHLPDGSSLPICGVAVDILHQYGVPTLAKVPVEGVEVDPEKVDRSPGSVVLVGARFNTVLQFPEGHSVPRIDWAPPDYR
ncbi:MAG TPA: protein kinase [Archangium sp.]|nr:protein kinase [Archangium sp.]